MRPIRVTVIDDDQDDFVLVKNFLNDVEGESYQIEWIPDSTLALEKIKLQTADVYLVDYSLDIRTGLDILDELKTLELTKPIILLTGREDRQIDISAMEKGAADFLSKKELTSSILERSIRYSIKRCEDRKKIGEMHMHKAEKEAAILANRNKSQFIAGISHEIRTPLGAIVGFVDLAMDPTTPENDKLEYMGIVKRNGEHLLNLINDFLDLAKMESGNVDILPEDFAWKFVVEDVVRLLKAKAIEKGISLNFETKNSVYDFIRCDPHRFRQILLNIIGNAIKFTDEGKVNVKCDVHCDSVSGEKSLVVTILDTGIGLSPEEQQRIFKPFKQANSSLVRKYGGTGLGLDLSKKLALAMGGDLILVNSMPKVGSTFKLVLPGCFNAHLKTQSRPTTELQV